MPLFQCNNDACYEVNEQGLPTSIYIFENTVPVCLKCKSKPPVVGSATILHFAYYAETGNLQGYKGRKVAIACQPLRGADPFNCMTPLPYLVNCPKCKKTQAYKDRWIPDPNNLMDYFNNPNTEEQKPEGQTVENT